MFYIQGVIFYFFSLSLLLAYFIMYLFHYISHKTAITPFRLCIRKEGLQLLLLRRSACICVRVRDAACGGEEERRVREESESWYTTTALWPNFSLCALSLCLEPLRSLPQMGVGEKTSRHFRFPVVSFPLFSTVNAFSVFFFSLAIFSIYTQ